MVISAVVFGILAIALSYVVPLFGPAVVQMPISIYGAIGGPLASLFFLGFYVPCSHKWVGLWAQSEMYATFKGVIRIKTYDSSSHFED